ncbi:MAG: four helix bundle suffix domain-containing protein [Bacteroidales bacterium]|nr:four helix bundle suffix domain-containing protein [Bacteroidales bacterium]
MTTETGFIPSHGNYTELLTYKKSLIIYSSTVLFCERFLNKRDRTVDQMVQAARSGKQNIIEGSMASATSKETEIKLTNVARASQEELLEDYKDFIRNRQGVIWEKDSKEALFVRRLAYRKDESFETYREFLETRDGVICANIMICLVNQCNYLLDRQIKRLEQDFVKDGGLRERMSQARRNFRKY